MVENSRDAEAIPEQARISSHRGLACACALRRRSAPSRCFRDTPRCFRDTRTGETDFICSLTQLGAVESSALQGRAARGCDAAGERTGGRTWLPGAMVKHTGLLLSHASIMRSEPSSSTINSISPCTASRQVAKPGGSQRASAGQLCSRNLGQTWKGTNEPNCRDSLVDDSLADWQERRAGGSWWQAAP